MLALFRLIGRILPLSVTLAVALLATAAQARNLLPDGDFESGSPQPWAQSNPHGHPLKVGITAEAGQVKSGSHAIVIEAGSEPFHGDDVTTALVLRLSAPVRDLPANTLLRAHLWIKTEGLEFLSPIGHRKYRFVDTTVKPLLVAIDTDGNASVGYGDNGSFKGNMPYTRVDFLFQLPPRSASVELQLQTYSPIKSGRIFVDDAVVEVAEPAAVPGDLPLCQIKRDAGGTPRLTIQGEVRTPLFTFGNSFSPKYYEEVRMAAGIGVHCVQFPINLPWVSTSTGMFEQVQQADPQAWFFPRIHYNVPRYKLDEYRAEWAVDHEGKPVADFPSLASDRFFAELMQQVELIARYLYNSPFKSHLLGLQMGYPQMGELFYPDVTTRYLDFSEVNRRKFAQWLASAYGQDLAKLNAAWKTQYGGFDAVQIPPAVQWELGDDGVFRDPQRRRAVSDYLRYHNELVAARMIEFAELVKRLTNQHGLTGFFYGYQNELIINSNKHGLPASGHLALRKMLASPAVDLICSPVSYVERKAGEPSNMHGLPDTIALAGKLPLIEEDSGTWLNEESEADFWNTRYATEFDTLNCLRRNFGNVLMHNQAAWWCDLWSDGRYLAQSVWDNNAKLFTAYQESIAQRIAFQPQIALIYNEQTYEHLKADCYALTERNASAQRSIFNSCGAPVGYYHIEDLDKLPASVKLIVFVNAFYVNAEQARLVESAKRDGRTLLWLYAPGYASESALSIEQMHALTGFRFGKSNVPIIPAVQVHPAEDAFNKYVGEHLIGSGEPISPTFHGDPLDTQTLVLGRYIADGRPALLKRRFTGWTSIFCGSPILTVPALRGLCKEAGVDLLVDPAQAARADVVAYNGRYLFDYARLSAGVRNFQVPGPPVTVTDVLSGETLATGVNAWQADFKLNEQRIFRLVPAAAAPTK